MLRICIVAGAPDAGRARQCTPAPLPSPPSAFASLCLRPLSASLTRGVLRGRVDLEEARDDGELPADVRILVPDTDDGNGGRDGNALLDALLQVAAAAESGGARAEVDAVVLLAAESGVPSGPEVSALLAAIYGGSSGGSGGGGGGTLGSGRAGVLVVPLGTRLVLSAPHPGHALEEWHTSLSSPVALGDPAFGIAFLPPASVESILRAVAAQPDLADATILAADHGHTVVPRAWATDLLPLFTAGASEPLPSGARSSTLAPCCGSGAGPVLTLRWRVPSRQA